MLSALLKDAQRTLTTLVKNAQRKKAHNAQLVQQVCVIVCYSTCSYSRAKVCP